MHSECALGCLIEELRTSLLPLSMLSTPSPAQRVLKNQHSPWSAPRDRKKKRFLASSNEDLSSVIPGRSETTDKTPNVDVTAGARSGHCAEADGGQYLRSYGDAIQHGGMPNSIGCMAEGRPPEERKGDSCDWPYQVATPVCVPPRDARSADFAGASIAGPGPLAAGAMSFTTPVPLPPHAAHARVPSTGQPHAQCSAAGEVRHQGYIPAPPAGLQRVPPDMHAHPSEQQAYQRSGAALREPSTRNASPASHGSSCGMDVSPAPSSVQTPRINFWTDPLIRGMDPSAPGFPQAVTPDQAPKEGIAEVLTGHLHAWGKTLRRMRRLGKSPPEPGCPEPDMQPLGRAFLVQPAEPDLARPSLQRGQPKHRPLSRLSREVSAEEAGLVRHAREYAAELAVQAGTAGVLHAASEKLRQEPKTFLPHQHHQVHARKAPCYMTCGSPMDAENAEEAKAGNLTSRSNVRDMPIPEGHEFRGVQGIWSSPVRLGRERASAHILATWQLEAAGARKACESLDLGPISPPAHVLSQHQALMHGTSMSPLAGSPCNLPRLDSSAESLTQQANKGSNSPMCVDTTASGKAGAHFSERLQQAVETRDADTMGQAWQAVKTGSVQPDIDSLNALLKSFCRINGNPSPADAEDLVAEVAKRGVLPNAATYHQLTAISVRHEQLTGHGHAW